MCVMSCFRDCTPHRGGGTKHTIEPCMPYHLNNTWHAASFLSDQPRQRVVKLYFA